MLKLPVKPIYHTRSFSNPSPSLPSLAKERGQWVRSFQSILSITASILKAAFRAERAFAADRLTMMD